MKTPFYITTTLPYVNAKPHMGHALEMVRADAIARFKKYQGYDVFFNTGTDEHGSKLYEGALLSGVTPQEFVDENSKYFSTLYPLLGLSEDLHVIRTTSLVHKNAAQKMWRLCFDRGYIYKKMYQTKYCVGCELEKTESELVLGRCVDHPAREIEEKAEENYFFASSKVTNDLKAKFASGEFVIPQTREGEMKSFIEEGLLDFSVSRIKNKMPWGVNVPNDDEHVMYVWFDALTSYISTLGWGSDDDSMFNKYWVDGVTVQYCGKDNTRQQSVMWQAMLLAAGLPTTDKIIVNGFVTGEGGVKMSKSIGNVVDPVAIVEKFGTDALRFYVLGGISTFEDAPCTVEHVGEIYQSWLQNGVGNLTSRIMKLSNTHLKSGDGLIIPVVSYDVVEALLVYDHRKAIECAMKRISALDKYIQDTEAFKVVKIDNDKGVALIMEYKVMLAQIVADLSFAMPYTASKIYKIMQENVSVVTPLFPRL